MTGVNDAKNVAFWQGEGACIDHDLEAADAMQELARTAWHPVSRPPTEGGDRDLVLTWREGWTEAMLARLGDIRLMAERGEGYGLYWARQRDVVLLPQSTGEG